MRFSVIPAALLIGLALVPPARSATPTDETAFFEKKIRPLLLARCMSCHDDKKARGGLRLDSRQAMLRGGDSGPALVPGKPDQSLLIKAVHHSETLQMPPKNKLPQAEIAALTEWIGRGAAWPREERVVATPSRGGERAFTPEETQFWAFRPIQSPPLPRVNDTSWARAPLDAFILAGLERAGMKPHPETDRRRLIRRVTFDLTGLPPTPDEVDAFLADSSANAYERLVDRLLASPAYGEKWGRRWLDVVRYADSNGMDENLSHAHAWRYRDWVIRQFNQDRPYDAFVREQIAGDLLGRDDDPGHGDRVTATGFLVLGPKMLAEDDPVKMRMDIIDEQVDTIGQVMLGMTLGCARCHDHKFDPITMSDYYALAGVFYSTRTMENYSVVAKWNERPVATPQTLRLLARHDSEMAALKARLTQAEQTSRKAVVQRLEKERGKADLYSRVAAEVLSRSGPLTLLSADPVRTAPANSLHVEAEAFTRGNVLKLSDGYGAGIGVIINAGPLPNFTEYDVTPAKPGMYQLAIRHAAAESRPIRVRINGRLLASQAAGEVTGSWNPEGQRWHAIAMVELPPGKSVVRMERDGPFPHLDRFVLMPMTAEQVARAPLSVDQAAARNGLLPQVLTAWVNRQHKATGADPFAYSAEKERELNLDETRKTEQIRQEVDGLAKKRPPADSVMAVQEGKPENLRVHLRGNHLTLGAEVGRRFPRILAGDQQASLPTRASGRKELAEWLTHPEHPLAARVIVNRVWHKHFGAGLVRSPDNFGRLGERPTHPELLDWLAREFIRSGWSIKHLSRLLVTSATYRQSASSHADDDQKDPDNRLWGRFSRRRLEAEEIRDGMLVVSGLLERTMGGSMLTIPNRAYVTGTGNKNYEDYQSRRRSLYLPVVRSAVYDVLHTLDFPDPSVPSGQRASTTLPTQGLLMLNSPVADAAAEAWARSLLAAHSSEEARVRHAMRQVHGRDPTPAEQERIRRFLDQAEQAGSVAQASAARQRAWRGLCRVLLAGNEFIFVD